MQFSGREITLSSLLRLFQKRRWLAVIVVIVVMLAGLAIAFRPPKYTAIGSIRVRPGSSSMYNVTAEKVLSGSDADDRIESEVTVLQSKSLLLDVARQLNLVHDPLFIGKSFGRNASLDDPAVRSYVIQAMKKRVHIERVPKTEVISVESTSQSPLASAKVVNALSNSYIERLFRNSFTSTQRASEWLNGQLNDLKQTIDRDQQQLVEMQGRLGGVGFDDTHNLVASGLESLAKANAEADVERIIAEARYRILQNTDVNSIEGALAIPSQSGAGAGGGGSTLLQNLRDQRAELEGHYADLDAQFGPNYPDVKQVKAQLQAIDREIQDEQTRVTNQAQMTYRAAQQNQNMTQAAFNRQKAEALENSGAMARYQILLHEYQVNRTLYEGLTERLREAGIISGLASNEVDVVDVADVPYLPSGPTRVEIIGMSLLAGFIAAGIAVLLAEALDTSIGGIDELISLVEMPALAVLPQVAMTKGQGRQLSTQNPKGMLRAGSHEILHTPGSPFSEGIRSLRTALLLSRAPRPPKVILFTSAGPKEGKSTISGNIACLLSQTNSRVLLIDADLRLPIQHTRFRLSNTRGLTSVLTGANTLAQAMQSIDGLPNLNILTAGPATAAAGILVSSPEMHALVNRCAEEFDFVLLDSPPCAAISDAIMLAHMSEAVVLVVRDGVSKKVALRRVVDNLLNSGAVMPGFVLNGVERRSLDYHSYYGDYGSYGGAEFARLGEWNGARNEV